jgi:ABC-type sugar transport system substrate-binding protein
MKAGWLGIAIGLVALMMSGCTTGVETKQTITPGVTKNAGKKIKIGLLPKTKGNPYFESCAEGAKEAEKELGNVEVVYDGPTSGDAAEAAKLIEQWTLKGFDVIAVSPNDPKVVASAMEAAKKAGIQVITWDADADKSTRSYFVNQATAQEIGHALVDTLATDIGGEQPEGDIAIVTATMNAANQNEWIKYIKEQLPKYPKLNLVDIKPSDDKQDKAFSVTQDLMKAYPKLKGILAISSVAFPGVAEAIQQGKMTGKVQVTGLSTPKSMRKFVEDGVVKSVVLWNTKDLGYLTIQAARALVDGKLKEGTTSISAGRLGEKKVEGDNVLLGKIMIFNKENIKDFDF